LASKATDGYYPCCSICKGCVHFFAQSGNNDKCLFCNSDRGGKTVEDGVEEIMKRVEAKDPGAMCVLAGYYYRGIGGLQQDRTKSIELYAMRQILGLVRLKDSR
jgi:hypothetical protein